MIHNDDWIEGRGRLLVLNKKTSAPIEVNRSTSFYLGNQSDEPINRRRRDDGPINRPARQPTDEHNNIGHTFTN